MTIIEYNNANNIVVEFENGYKKSTAYKEFKLGNIKSPYDKTIYGIGYIGEGDYFPYMNKIPTRAYKYWNSMILRCYDKKYTKDKPTYEDKSVCEEWHNFQNFAKWFDENYYECNNEKEMQLDKDILFKGNKVYSPDTCVFVPNRINALFTKRQNDRGNCPIGVTYNSKTNKYISRCNCIDKRVNIGSFNTPEEAFYKYKEFKEDYIKKVANEYKDKIPVKLYEAMCKYVVEISD